MHCENPSDMKTVRINDNRFLMYKWKKMQNSENWRMRKACCVVEVGVMQLQVKVVHALWRMRKWLDEWNRCVAHVHETLVIGTKCADKARTNIRADTYTHSTHLSGIQSTCIFFLKLMKPWKSTWSAVEVGGALHSQSGEICPPTFRSCRVYVHISRRDA